MKSSNELNIVLTFAFLCCNHMETNMDSLVLALGGLSIISVFLYSSALQEALNFYRSFQKFNSESPSFFIM